MGAASCSTAQTTTQQQAEYLDVGFVVLRSGLDRPDLRRHIASVDRVYREQRQRGALRGSRSLHLPSVVAQVPELAELVANAAVLPLIRSVLDGDVQLRSSHLGVDPQQLGRPNSLWNWRNTGAEHLESVVVTYWLSDVSEPGRGHLTVVPGSHRQRQAQPADPSWQAPVGAVHLTVAAGDVVVLNRRAWYALSRNYSPLVRKYVYLEYTRTDVPSIDGPCPELPQSTG